MGRKIGKVIEMSGDQHEQTQNQRIRDLEKSVGELKTQISALMAKIDTLTQIGKGLAILAGAAIGIDVIPMI